VITAVDTSVLIDIFAADARFGRASAERIREALADGRVLACDVVWAEVAGLFPTASAARAALSELGIEFSATSEETALGAVTAWKEYRRRGGQRERVIADFLIGAHAAGQADRLLTRDRGFYRTYFRSLKVIEPAST
jgi:predicted nucleic acid-binding protein